MLEKVFIKFLKEILERISKPITKQLKCIPRGILEKKSREILGENLHKKSEKKSNNKFERISKKHAQEFLNIF